ncbi:MAG: cell division protein FtsZ [Chloroflexota bacterium]
MRRYSCNQLRKARIGVIGAGNSGRIAIESLLEENYYHAQFILVDTDQSSMALSKQGEHPLFDRILLVDNQSKPHKTLYGTDGDTHLGEAATWGTTNKIKSVIRHFDMLFLLGGLGGGTASAALPIIAQAAKELDIMTVAIVTSPFGFEELERHRIAYQSITALNLLADALLVMHGDDLLDQVKTRTHLEKAWAQANKLRHNCVYIIEQLTQYPSIINIDFADVKAILNNKGASLFTHGIGKGDEKIQQAVQNALICPWLGHSIVGAKNLLMHIVVPVDQPFLDIVEVANKITASVGSQASIIWGVSEDPCLGDEIHILLLATGFNEITQTSHVTNSFMREALDYKRERHTLADHYWSVGHREASAPN